MTGVKPKFCCAQSLFEVVYVVAKTEKSQDPVRVEVVLQPVCVE